MTKSKDRGFWEWMRRKFSFWSLRKGASTKLPVQQRSAGEFRERFGLIGSRALDEVVSRLTGRKIRTTPEEATVDPKTSDISSRSLATDVTPESDLPSVSRLSGDAAPSGTPAVSGATTISVEGASLSEAEAADTEQEVADTEDEAADTAITSSVISVEGPSSGRESFNGAATAVVADDGAAQQLSAGDKKQLSAEGKKPSSSDVNSDGVARQVEAPPHERGSAGGKKPSSSDVNSDRAPASGEPRPASNPGSAPPRTSQIRRSVYTSSVTDSGEAVPVTKANAASHTYRLYLLPRGSDQLFVSWRIDGELVEEMVTLALRYTDGLALVSVHHAPSLVGEAFIQAPTANVSYVAELYVGTQRVVRSAEAKVLPKNMQTAERPHFVQLAPMFEPWPETSEVSMAPRSVLSTEDDVSVVIRDEYPSESTPQERSLPTWWPQEDDALPEQVMFPNESKVLPPPFAAAPVTPWKSDLPGGIYSAAGAWSTEGVSSAERVRADSWGTKVRMDVPSSATGVAPPTVAPSSPEWGRAQRGDRAAHRRTYPASAALVSSPEFALHRKPPLNDQREVVGGASSHALVHGDNRRWVTTVKRWSILDERIDGSSAGLAWRTITQREMVQQHVAEDVQSMMLPPVQFADAPVATVASVEPQPDNVWLATAMKPDVGRLTRYLQDEGVSDASFEEYPYLSEPPAPEPVAAPSPRVVQRPQKAMPNRRVWARTGVLPPLRSVPVFPKPPPEPERPALPSPRRVTPLRRPPERAVAPVAPANGTPQSLPNIHRLMYRSEVEEADKAEVLGQTKELSTPAKLASVRRLMFRR